LPSQQRNHGGNHYHQLHPLLFRKGLKGYDGNYDNDGGCTDNDDNDGNDDSSYDSSNDSTVKI
jgi:hypothetical protein